MGPVFTIVHLLSLLGMGGLLALGFGNYSARARQSEAKVALASIYTAERSFAIEQDTYSLCLKDIGYEPMAEDKRRYAVGFGSATVDSGKCWTEAGKSCLEYSPGRRCQHAEGSTWFDANLRGQEAGPAVARGKDIPAAFSRLGRKQFIAAAVGSVGGAASYDIWTIDEKKELKNEVAAFSERKPAGLELIVEAYHALKIVGFILGGILVVLYGAFHLLFRRGKTT